MFLLATLLAANPAFASATCSIDDHHARPVSTGEVFVDNHYHHAIALYADGEYIASLPTGHSTVRLPLGHTHLVAMSGEDQLARAEVTVDDHHRVSFEIEDTIVRATGSVMVQNMRPYRVAVYIDGRRRGSLSAWGTRTYTVDTGSTRVELRDERGHHSYSVLSRRVDVGRYETVTVQASSAVASSNSGHQRPR